MAYKQLSREASEELVRYLYLLIDEIQFSRPYEEETGEDKPDNDQLPIDFDDPIPFGDE
jgi:hypothetical protein